MENTQDKTELDVRELLDNTNALWLKVNIPAPSGDNDALIAFLYDMNQMAHNAKAFADALPALLDAAERVSATEALVDDRTHALHLACLECGKNGNAVAVWQNKYKQLEERVQSLERVVPANTCAAWSEEDWIDSDGFPTQKEKRMERLIEDVADHLEGLGWDAVRESFSARAENSADPAPATDAGQGGEV